MTHNKMKYPTHVWVLAFFTVHNEVDVTQIKVAFIKKNIAGHCWQWKRYTLKKQNIYQISNTLVCSGLPHLTKKKFPEFSSCFRLPWCPCTVATLPLFDSKHSSTRPWWVDVASGQVDCQITWSGEQFKIFVKRILKKEIFIQVC